MRRIFYLTSGTEKTRILLNALTPRYCVALMSERRSGVSLFLSSEGKISEYNVPVPNREGQGNPSLTRYLQLARFWVAAVSLMLSKMRGQRFDACICEGIQGAPLFLVLRRFGVFKKVVYYSQDWFPNKYFTQILDRLLVLLCDETWNYTQQIIDARHLQNHASSNKERVVGPIYDYPTPNTTIKRSLNICYLGSIRADLAIDLVIQAVAMLEEQRGYRIVVHLIGTTVSPNAQADIVSVASRLGVSDRVVFHGFLGPNEMHELLRQSVCGIALFTGGRRNYSNYAIPGKIREYLENGLPVILNRDNAMAEALEEQGAGIAVDLTTESIAAALHALLSSDETAAIYGQKAYMYAAGHASAENLYRAIDGLPSVDTATAYEQESSRRRAA